MDKYHISDGKKETGPFTLEQLKEIPINKDYLVWKNGMEKWIKINEISELDELIYSVPPPISVLNKKKIKQYKIKHITVSIVILLVLLFGRLYYSAKFVHPMHLSKSYQYVTLTLLFLTIIISIIIYYKNIDKLKK